MIATAFSKRAPLCERRHEVSAAHISARCPLRKCRENDQPARDEKAGTMRRVCDPIGQGDRGMLVTNDREPVVLNV
jgi:hypothetical protein